MGKNFRNLFAERLIIRNKCYGGKIRVPLNNKLTNGIAMAQWGAEDGHIGAKEAIMLNDCFPCDSTTFETLKVSGDKIEERGQSPHTVHMFTKAARQQSRLFSAVYGREHLAERLGAVGE